MQIQMQGINIDNNRGSKLIIIPEFSARGTSGKENLVRKGLNTLSSCTWYTCFHHHSRLNTFMPWQLLLWKLCQVDSK